MLFIKTTLNCENALSQLYVQCMSCNL